MTGKTDVAVLLLAGGQGARVLSSRPKQFIEIEGESVLLHTMRAFESHPLVSKIFVVCNPEWNNYVNRQVQDGGISKMAGTIASGETSHQSLLNGIHGMHKLGLADDAIVMVHDSVRPLVSYEIISNNINTCHDKGNAVTATHSNEAFMDVNEQMQSNSFIPREALMRAQTPITFRMHELQEMTQEAQKRGISESQSLFTLANELCHVPLNIVKGNMLNFKITLPQDIEIYRKLKSINCD